MTPKPRMSWSSLRATAAIYLGLGALVALVLLLRSVP